MKVRILKSTTEEVKGQKIRLTKGSVWSLRNSLALRLVKEGKAQEINEAPPVAPAPRPLILDVKGAPVTFELSEPPAEIPALEESGPEPTCDEVEHVEEETKDLGDEETLEEKE